MPLRLTNLKRYKTRRFYHLAMLYLVLPLLLIAAIAAGGGFAYTQALTSLEAEEMPLAPLGASYQDAQLYWRELEQARDWDSLKAQLRRWHRVANPGWDEAQIDEVTRALNQAVFRFAERPDPSSAS